MKIQKTFITRTIGGSTVLVPVGETTKEFNGLIMINESAAFIWEHLEKVNSMDEMVQILLDEFEVSEELARKDAIGFTEELLRNGFISRTIDDTW